MSLKRAGNPAEANDLAFESSFLRLVETQAKLIAFQYAVGGMYTSSSHEQAAVSVLVGRLWQNVTYAQNTLLALGLSCVGADGKEVRQKILAVFMGQFAQEARKLQEFYNSCGVSVDEELAKHLHARLVQEFDAAPLPRRKPLEA